MGCSVGCSAEVGTEVSAQLEGWVTAAALGAAAAAVYDLLRTVRLRRRKSRRLTHALDALFLLAVSPALLWYTLRMGQGELRLVMLCAMLVGVMVYLWVLSPLVLPLWDFWLGAAAATVRLLCRPALWLAAAAKKIARAAKKAFIFCRKCAMIRKSRAEKEAIDCGEKSRAEAQGQHRSAAGHRRAGGVSGHRADTGEHPPQ